MRKNLKLILIAAGIIFVLIFAAVMIFRALTKYEIHIGEVPEFYAIYGVGALAQDITIPGVEGVRGMLSISIPQRR